MAKLTNKYDVVQMGDTPDFWSGIADRLEQYIDPEFQRKLKIDREEQRRYKARVEKEAEQTAYDREQDAIDRQLEKEARIKADTQDAYDKFHDDLQVSYDQGMGEEYRAQLIDAAMYDMSFDTGDLKTGIDINKLEAMKEASLKNARYNKSWQSFMQNPNQTSYDSLVSLADSKEKRDMITKNADPKLEKFKLENQTVAIANLMNTYLKNPIDSNTLSQFTKLGARGAEAVFGLFDMEIKRRQGNKDKRIELAYKLIEMESDETMSQSEKDAVMNMKMLGMQLLSKEGVLETGKEKNISYNIKPVFDPNQVRDNDLVELGGQKLSGKRLKEILAVNPISDEELSKLKISRAGKMTKPSPRQRMAGTVPQLIKEPEPVNIATKKQIDKAAKDLGWNNKLDPDSIKFQLILEELEKRFPNYNFQANQIESD